MKTEQSLFQERSVINQNVAFTTARNMTANAEQKRASGEWKTGGGVQFKKKRAGLILKSAAEMAGAQEKEAMTTIGPKEKIQIGTGRINRISAGSASSGGWAGKGRASNDPNTPNAPQIKIFTTRKHISKRRKHGLWGNGEKKGNGKGGNGKLKTMHPKKDA